MAIADVLTFWAKARWGDLWGVIRWVNGKWTNPHRGHDIKAAAGEAVPALRAGRVVLVSERSDSSILGYHVVLDTGDDFDYYCHLLVGTRPNVGDWIDVGESVGLVAGWGDFHGSAWTGIHVHFGSGPSVRSVYEGPTRDATAIVASVLANLKTAPADLDMEEIMAFTLDQIAQAVGQKLLNWPLTSIFSGKPNELKDFITNTAEGARVAADQSTKAAARAADAVAAAKRAEEAATESLSIGKQLLEKAGQQSPSEITVKLDAADLVEAVRTVVNEPATLANIATAINTDAARRLAE